jgi:hypothetical protein
MWNLLVNSRNNSFMLTFSVWLLEKVFYEIGIYFSDWLLENLATSHLWTTVSVSQIQIRYVLKFQIFRPNSIFLLPFLIFLEKILKLLTRLHIGSRGLGFEIFRLKTTGFRVQGWKINICNSLELKIAPFYNVIFSLIHVDLIESFQWYIDSPFYQISKPNRLLMCRENSIWCKLKGWNIRSDLIALLLVFSLIIVFWVMKCITS